MAKNTRSHWFVTPVMLLMSIVALFAAGPALAQEITALLGPPMLQFSFSNPGARSMGFGGAFVALADDATAAFANPAGLVQITRPEVSLEGRSWSYSTPFTRQARLEGGPIGADAVAGVLSGTSEDDLAGVSFLSFVYPKGKGSIAFYRHRLAEFESLTRVEQVPRVAGRVLDQQVRTDLELTGYGVSGAYGVSEALSLGLSLVYFDGDFDLVADLHDTAESPGAVAPDSYPPESRVARTSLRIDDGAWAVTAGWLLSLSERWRLGGFYRQGPELELRGDFRAGPAFGLAPAGTILGRGTSPIAVPDVYGLGIAFRPAGGRLTVACEWDRVEYSSLLDSLDPELIDASTLSRGDGDELHLGAEVVFRRGTPVAAVRLGVWLDPDHRPSFSGAATPLEQALLPPGDDDLHYALGVGWAFESFQIDLGADFSELVDTASLSAIYSF